jgi:hypothetical protein
MHKSTTNATTNLPHSGESIDSWEKAIAKAQIEMADAANRVDRLKRSIKVLRGLRDAGEPWPGASGSTQEVLGQEGVLGQSPAVGAVGRCGGTGGSALPQRSGRGELSEKD